jgi:predicted dehydrogenase
MNVRTRRSISNATRCRSIGYFPGLEEIVSHPTDARTACRVSFIGAGSMTREHLRAFSDVPQVVLAGLHSRTRSRAEALASEFSVPHVCDSIDELHDQTRADLVVVSVPELSANAVARQCFAFPWTVLIEKPAGYDLADAEAIASEAHRHHRRVFVALNRRHYSSTQAALTDLATRDEPRYVRVQDQQDQAAALAAGQPEPVVRNWMYANSIHTIDYLRLLGRGTVTAVRPVVRWTPGKPGIVVSEIAFDSGDVGIYEGVWNGPGPWAVTVSTPSRRWEMRPLEQAMFQNRGERTLHSVDIHSWDKTFKAGFRRQAELAVNAARGAATPWLPTIDDGLQTMRLIAKIFE